MNKTSVVALAAFAAGAASVQAAAAGRDPLDTQAQVHAIEYRSAFSDYRPHREVTPTPWRELNDRVKRLGGHVGHMAKPGTGDTGLAQSDAAPSGAVTKPQAGGHAGHPR